MFTIVQWQLKQGVDTFGTLRTSTAQKRSLTRLAHRHSPQQSDIRSRTARSVVSFLFLSEERAAHAPGSDANQTGLLTATDSTLAFLPLAKIVDSSRLETLLDQFNQETQQAGQIPIQKVQEPFMREWFQEDRVASLEFIQWSKGLINPAPNTSYTDMLGGLLVSLFSSRASGMADATSGLAPHESRYCGRLSSVAY